MNFAIWDGFLRRLVINSSGINYADQQAPFLHDVAFNYLRHLSVVKWWKMPLYFLAIFKNNFKATSVKMETFGYCTYLYQTQVMIQTIQFK